MITGEQVVLARAFQKPAVDEVLSQVEINRLGALPAEINGWEAEMSSDACNWDWRCLLPNTNGVTRKASQCQADMCIRRLEFSDCSECCEREALEGFQQF